MSNEFENLLHPDSEEFRESEYERKYNLANIPKSLRNVSLELLGGAVHREKITEWMNRIKKAKRSGGKESGLYLHGQYGTGKSSIAAGLAMWATRNRLYSYYTPFINLAYLKRENPTWSVESESGVWDYMLKVPLLVVDDLFRHWDTYDGKKNATTLEELLDIRMMDGELLHVFTSNLGIDGIPLEAERLGMLIQQCCYIQPVTGVDFRKLKNQVRKVL